MQDYSWPKSNVAKGNGTWIAIRRILTYLWDSSDAELKLSKDENENMVMLLLFRLDKWQCFRSQRWCCYMECWEKQTVTLLPANLEYMALVANSQEAL